MEITNDARQVLQFINQTQRSVFLTGKAGTGKTTLLRQIIQTTHKNTVVVAPTGIAALNAGGVTIHSMFQLPFAAFLPILKDDGFHFLSEEELPDGYRVVFSLYAVEGYDHEEIGQILNISEETSPTG